MNNRYGQHGNILLSVMVISAVIMGIGATLYNNYVVSEADAVDKSLVDIRAYWAMKGHVNYMLGRVGYQGLCPANAADSTSYTQLGSCRDTSATSSGDSQPGDNETSNPPFTSRTLATPSRVASMQYLFDGDSTPGTSLNTIELHDITPHNIQSPGVRRWHYPVDLFTADPTSNYGDYSLDVESIVRDLQEPSDSDTNNDARMRVDLDVRASNGAPIAEDAPSRLERLTIGFCVQDLYQSSPGVYSPDTSRYCSAVTDQEGWNKIQFIQWNKPFP